MDILQFAVHLPKILSAINAVFSKYSAAMSDGRLSPDEIFQIGFAAILSVADILGFEMPSVEWMPEQFAAKSETIKKEIIKDVDTKFADNITPIVVPAERLKYMGK